MNRKVAVRLASSFFALALAVPAFAQEKAAEVASPQQEKGVIALIVGLVLAIVALFVSLGLAMKAVQVAINMFDKLTKNMDEWAELKKGNVAVGILMASVIYAIANVISSGVTALTSSLMNPAWSFAYVLSIVIGIINLMVALWIGTYVVGLSIRILDKMTKNIEEMEEVAKGNVAVAIMIAGVLLGVSTVVAQGVEGLSKVVNVQSVMGALGIRT